MRNYIPVKRKAVPWSTSKTSSAALPSIAPPCGVLLHTPQSSLLGALHLISCWWSGIPITCGC